MRHFEAPKNNPFHIDLEEGSGGRWKWICKEMTTNRKQKIKINKGGANLFRLSASFLCFCRCELWTQPILSHRSCITGQNCPEAGGGVFIFLVSVACIIWEFVKVFLLVVQCFEVLLAVSGLIISRNKNNYISVDQKVYREKP